MQDAKTQEKLLAQAARASMDRQKEQELAQEEARRQALLQRLMPQDSSMEKEKDKERLYMEAARALIAQAENETPFQKQAETDLRERKQAIFSGSPTMVSSGGNTTPKKVPTDEKEKEKAFLTVESVRHLKVVDDDKKKPEPDHPDARTGRPPVAKVASCRRRVR